MDQQIKNKIEETEFFLEEMNKSFQDDRRFKFMYSAFLSAGQSALYYLVSRYKDTPGFNDWYWGKKVGKGLKVGGRIENPEIKHLMNARGCIIHVEDIPQATAVELSIGASITIVDPRMPKEQTGKSKKTTEIQEVRHPRTIVRWLINEDSYMRYEKHGNLIDDTKYIQALQKSYSAEPVEPKTTDILKLSKAELDEVKKLIGECETRFP